METSDKQFILNTLIEMKDKGPQHGFGLCTNMHIAITRKLGICLEASSKCREADIYLETLWVGWPLFSGQREYPVPEPLLDAKTAYHISAFHMWDKSTRYGQNRWALLDFLIEEITKDLNNEL